MKSFEKNLERLEEINELIRKPETELESALKLFEEGVVLAQALEDELRTAEQKVEILINPEASEDQEPEFSLRSD